MKKRIIILGLVTTLIICVIYIFRTRNTSLSSDQNNIRQLLGNPSHFVISYLPQGESDLVRNEVWYYKNSQKEITFLQGKFVLEKEWSGFNVASETNLLPENFDFYTSLDEMKSIIDCPEIEELDYIPGFSDNDNLKTYYCEKALFIIENGGLSYFQTLGEGDKQYYINELNALDKEIEQGGVNIDYLLYSNSDLGFEVQYPKSWFINSGVLSSYDTDYMQKGLPLPEIILKCDFIPYNPSDVDILSPQMLSDNDLKISKGIAQDNSGADGPGLGDSVIFLLESKTSGTKESLLCFQYDESFEKDLIEMLKTFKFIN